MRQVPENAGDPVGRRAHLPELDGLRGVAVLGVMGSHLFFGTPHGPVSALALRTLAAGAAGVDLFFVLSGFLITGILFDSLGSEGYFGDFFARRARRIFPLYYVVLALFLVLDLWKRWGAGRQLLSLALFLQNTHLLTQPIWRSQELPLVHFWSLAVEAQFYLFWPVVVWLLRTRRRVMAGCLAGAVVSFVLRYVLRAHGVPYEDLHAMTLCRLDVLLLGGAVAMLVRGMGKEQAFRRVWAWLAVLGLVALLTLQLPQRGDAFRFSLLSLVHAAGAAGVLAWTLRPGSRLRALMSWRVLRVAGRYSYGLYVWHYILADVWRERLTLSLRDMGLRNPAASVVLSGLLLSAASFAASLASFECFERRFLTRGPEGNGNSSTTGRWA